MSEDEIHRIQGRALADRKQLRAEVNALKIEIGNRIERLQDVAGLTKLFLSDPGQKSAAGDRPLVDDLTRQMNALDLPSLGSLCNDLFLKAERLRVLEEQIRNFE